MFDNYKLPQNRMSLFVSYLLIIHCLYLCKSETFENRGDFRAGIKHVQRTNANSFKYSKMMNTLPIDTLLLDSLDTEVVLRGKKALASSNLRDNLNDTLCNNHTLMFLNSLTDKDGWALEMIDAIGKPSSGILDAHLTWLGDWEECINVQAVIYADRINKTGPSYPYKGKYCLTSFTFDQNTAQPQGILLNIGVCVPESCNAAEAIEFVKILINLAQLNRTGVLPDPSLKCQENKLEYTGKAIAVMTVCAVFLAIILVATTYDIVITFILSKRTGEYEILPSTGKRYGTSNGEVSLEESDVHNRNENHMNESVNVANTSYQTGLAGRLLLSFSVYTNAPKLLSTSQPVGTLTSINGIRFISMTWVILGHTYSFGASAVENIARWFPELMKQFSFQAIGNATFSVDTFFVLSGLLVSYLSLREMKNVGGVRNFKWGMFYFHRFWRLTPPYMLFLMLYVPTVKYYSNGPLWSQQGIEINECKDTWWTNLLYINNLYKTKEMCMGWSWYLANDMQFYVISPLMLIPLYYSSIFGTLSCLALILVNFIATGAISKQNELPSNILLGDMNNDVFELTYIKPWCRVGPYAVGFFTGYILYKTNCIVKMPKWLNLLGWAIATSVAIMILYGLYTSDGTSKLGVDMSALYNATSRTAWGMCICWVIFACATGNGGPVNKLLSWNALIPLSRLTYCAYLVHPVVMIVYYFSRRTLMYWYELEITYLYLGNLCLSYAVAFIVSLAFESPMMALEKVLLHREKRS